MPDAANSLQFDAIARFALDPALAVPEDVLLRMSTLLIDTLGVAAGASGLDVAVIARDYACDYHGANRVEHAATLLFDGRRCSLPGAAWALATQIDNLDGHDGYNPTKGHIGCALVPALFALAEHRPDLSGRQALAALAMGYEVAARAAVALHATVADYHTSGAWNALGVAALGSRLRGHGGDVFRQALGIAEYHGPRSQMMREIDNPTMLRDGSGMGAYVGMSAALLAERGFTGAPAITVEGPEVAHVWADLGQDWTVMRNYIKPYPICRWAHGALEALRQLMAAHDFAAEEVTRMRVGTFAYSARLFAGVPQDTRQAQYSLGFALAVLLVHGRIAPEHVTGEGLRDPRVLAALDRIAVREEPRHSARYPEGRWSDITITLRDGRVIASGDVNARGGPEDPLSEQEIRDKLFRMAGVALSDGRIRAIWQMREALLDPACKFSQLAGLIHPATDGP
ncbi:2-methylcitrate dehydratase PrpD [Roseovarius azorensis]|uniref:2-methylcitrate dehydratase PrpD n=1 Tax=Roseovarius azorensis TaxID=1287727 RepID=A0A1H7PQH4_9RHOB|nr:MmgE/PrpD family protein [Roseovarius azorensis]SEL37297.1 2-methylcitrate dehydratase PrpD [Roseovarius azorensis]